MILRYLTLTAFALFANPTLADSLEEPLHAHTSVTACTQALQSPASESSLEMPSPLRLKSWNVMKFDIPGAQEELELISADTELVFLQESLRGAAKASHRQKYRYFSPGYSRGNEASGVEIRSQLPADLICELTYTEPWLRTPKAISIVRLPFREGALLLINVHAINFTLTAMDYARYLAELSQLVMNHQGPIVLAGDFNHWNAWRRRALQSWAQDLELREVDFNPDWRSQHLGSRVDTIFLKGLSAITSMALPSKHSDHNAIAASLVLAKPAGDPKADSLAEDVSPMPRHSVNP